MSLPDLSIRRPVATAMLFVAVAVLGVVSFARLPVALLPDVAFPTLAVSTTFPDAGPTEVERFVTEPIESQLSRVPGVREVTSRSRQGQSLVRLRFAWGTDMEFAMLDVRERLENLDVDASGADRPTILRTDPSADPAMTLAVTGRDLLQLRELSETVFKRRLEQLDGVALAAVTGGPEREVQVTVDPERLASFGLSMADVQLALDRANYSAPGGRIQRGRFEYSLRTQGEFRTVSEIQSVTVAAGGGADVSGGGADGSSIRLADVADVREGFADRETLARYGGEPAVGMQIFQESGANTVRVADRVEEVLEQLRVEFGDVTIQTASSQATFIRNAIANVVQALVLGGVLAFLVLFLFLRDPRYPLAVGVSIPISILAAFGLFYLFDVSLNVMSLGGLALGVGMLVDNSIVVLENIFRHGEEGSEPERAAAWGAREVAAAITASTLTTIAVFGPVLYVEGVAGALFGDLSLSVTFSLLASLLVAVTLVPVLAARLAGGGKGEASLRGGGSPGGSDEMSRTGEEDARPGSNGSGAGGGDDEGPGWRQKGWRRARPAVSDALELVVRVRSAAARAGGYVVESVRLTVGDLWSGTRSAGRRIFGPFLDAFERRFERFAERYEDALEWSLDHRAAVVTMAALTLAVAAGIGVLLPRNVMPDVDEGRFRAELELPVGTPLQVTAGTSDRIEEVLLGTEGVETVFTRVGRARGSELAARELSGLNSAAFEVRLSEDSPPVGEVVGRFRASVRDAGIDASSLSVQTGQSTSLGQALALTDADLAVQVQDADLDRALTVADTVRERLSGLAGLADVRVDVQRTQPELEIEVRREAAARHDLSVQEVADAVEGYLRGLETERPFTQFAEKIGIRIRVPEARRSDLSEVLNFRVEGIPVRELVEVRGGYGPVEIRREGQARTVRVLADVTGGGLTEGVEAARARTADLTTSGQTIVRVGGANEEMRESFRSLLFAFGLALCLVYLILAAQFESILQPLVILAAVPLAAVGAVLALWITGSGVNVMSGIGVIVLVGIVVNDAIIKVDFVNQRRAAGRGFRRAIVEAGRLRLRPILMTTVTTVFGLLPLALGWGAGADLRAPLAVAVIGGLLSSTLLTLLVVPVLYDLLVPETSEVRVRARVPVGSPP
ncbi:MAG: efflux RND transporter permease subunit [Gemmatimonadota bacterium]